MEFSEIGKFGEDIHGFNEKGVTIVVEEYFKNKEKMKEQFKRLNMDLEKFTFEGETGKVKLTYEGRPVDFEKASKAMSEGRLLESLKEYGAPENVLKDKKVIEYSKNYENAFKQQEGIKMKDYLDKNIKEGIKMKNEIGEPKNVDELNRMIEENPELKAKLEKMTKDLQKAAEDAKKEGKTEVKKGTWTETAYKAGEWGLKILLAGALYNLINQHKDAMNGCWLVNKATGKKCKIQKLSCNDKTWTSLCDPDNTCTDSCTKATQQSCFDNPCIKCTSPVTSPDSTVTQSCEQKLEQCTGSECSELCSCDRMGCPEGYYLKCVNVDFWGAAIDLGGEPFEWGSDIITKAFKIFKIILEIALGLIGLWLLFKLVMWGIHMYQNKKHDNEKNIHNEEIIATTKSVNKKY